MFEHAEPTFHVPVMPHTSGAFMVVQPGVPGVHTPLHLPLTQAWFAQGTGLLNVPVESHDSTWMSSWHVVSPGAHMPLH
jgi:hypothetical protein